MVIHLILNAGSNVIAAWRQPAAFSIFFVFEFCASPVEHKTRSLTTNAHNRTIKLPLDLGITIKDFGSKRG